MVQPGDANDTTASTCVDVPDLREDAGSLSPEEFADRHGSAFLLLAETELRRPQGPSATEVLVLGLDDEASACTAGMSLRVYPVRRTERSVGHLVTVGRAPNNDVVIRDVSVSRFHAFLKQGDDGAFFIQDANSANGTIVNGVSVPSQGHGPPASLKSGDNVRLGQVEFTLLDASALIEFVLAFDR